MALSSGARLGPFEIISLLGVGGMGEVYRATDTNLKRAVAIKVLPAAVAGDAERLARFQREAEVLATLNHPNIAQIYGLERQEGQVGRDGQEGTARPAMLFIVMELVEGPTLEERLRAQGSAGLPVPEALAIARQIAEALEAGHEQGIVHRDLKPANVKVRDDGTVKVLDYGLAKGMEPAATLLANASISPTLSSPALMTGAGMILGTAVYMSPEQASGKPVDKRADIWSFGVVLWEMLTGRRLFDGETMSHTLADVLRGPIDFSQLPEGTPRPIRELLRRCLTRDVKKRLRDIGEARLLIEEALSGAGDDAASAVVPAVASGVVSRTRERIAWTLAAALGVVSLAALALAAFAYLGRAPAEVRPTRFFVSPPDGWRLPTAVALSGVSPAPLAVSPDGSWVAFVATAATGGSRLWVRALDTLTAQELPGTDGALSPFWSPDSRSLAFFADGKLKKIAVAGGPAVPLCDGGPASPLGGTWGRDGVIVFAPSANSALQQVSELGGVPSTATVLGDGETYHGRPSFLPDGRHVIHSVIGGANAGIYLTSLDGPARQLLIKSPVNTPVHYARGHLLFLRETTLMAQPFNLDGLALTGEPVPIAEQVQTVGTNPPNGFFSASDTGVLVYQTGTADGGNRQLTWFDRTGKLLGTVEKPGEYNTVALSPDGGRVAVSRTDAGNTDLLVHEFARSTSMDFTTDPAQDYMAAWSPDGSRIAWSTNRNGNFNLYEKVSNGAGTAEEFLKSSDTKYAYDWSLDGHFLLYATTVGGKYELWVLPLTGDDRTPRPYLQPDFSTGQARFSPNSRYVAYTSNESGRSEVYVQPFPTAAGEKWKVSEGGGSQPRWRRDGKELFYIAADSKLMAVEVAATPAFTPGVIKALFAAPIFGGGANINVTRYDVKADGEKFLINAVQPETTTAPPAPITVVLNWDAGLKP